MTIFRELLAWKNKEVVRLRCAARGLSRSSLDRRCLARFRARFALSPRRIELRVGQTASPAPLSATTPAAATAPVIFAIAIAAVVAAFGRLCRGSCGDDRRRSRRRNCGFGNWRGGFCFNHALRLFGRNRNHGGSAGLLFEDLVFNAGYNLVVFFVI